jgi:Cu(I)/Ag(I) efflux system membrane fusion protein
MDLIPLENDGYSVEGERQISVSSYAKKLMEIETSYVTREFHEAEVRLVGKVGYDETRWSYISAWVSGRLDRLFVNYTGISVKKGDHMAEIYSPELLTAQEELIAAIKTVHALGKSESNIVSKTTKATVHAAREKLRLLGLHPWQIKKIETEQKRQDHITIYAPASGIVIHKDAQEGMYVKTGTKIYTIADLSSVWVNMDAYESDLNWIRYGGKVEFTTESYPGKIFFGTISFIDPVIDPMTRTAKIRVNVNNKNLELKPGMFVRAVVKSKIASDGKVMNADLAGKWISPMHPEIVKEKPGTCDVCDIPLVSAESLGYVAKEQIKAPLVIPASAAMMTGKRAVVYIEIPNTEKPTYEGREIKLGARVGNFYIVKDGLNEGDRVVTKGAFKLDAELQIQAKPSMMSEGGIKLQLHQHGEVKKEAEPMKKIKAPMLFRKQLNVVLNNYFSIQKALAKDAPEDVSKHAKLIRNGLINVDMQLLKGHAHMVWMEHLKNLQPIVDNLLSESTLEKQREAFLMLSDQLLQTILVFSPNTKTIYKAFCSMAFNNQGAFWLQDSKEIVNPYFGKMMLRCGEINSEIKPQNEE